MTTPAVFSPPSIPIQGPLPIAELKNIAQRYKDRDGKTERTVIDGLNLRVEDKPGQGQFVVILGASGCGKSTLLRYLAGLQVPTSGDVLLNGLPRKKSDVVGMVFQQYSCYPWLTVLENVMLGLEFRGVEHKQARQLALSALADVELTGHEKKYAKLPTLSGGQLQRVAIASSLVTSPQMILMDEPFGALDTNTRFRMQLNLCALWERLQSTIFFVTHDLREAVFLGDDIYMMSANPGRIVDTLHIDLPLHRDRSTVRTPRYIQLVNELEDRMLKLDPKNK